MYQGYNSQYNRQPTNYQYGAAQVNNPYLQQTGAAPSQAMSQYATGYTTYNNYSNQSGAYPYSSYGNSYDSYNSKPQQYQTGQQHLLAAVYS